MQITITFDPTDKKVLANVKAFVDGALGAEAVVHSGTDTPVVVHVADVKDEMKADTKAADDAAAKKKAKDDAAAKKKADDEAAAAKKAEEEAAAAAKKAEDEAAAAGPKITREEVRQKLKEYGALEGREAAIGILKKHGAPSITELAEDKFAAVMADCDV